MADTGVRRPVFSRFYSHLAAPALERAGAGELRQRLLSGLSGKVAEPGAGDGLNFVHYPSEVSAVLAVEPESRLRAHAEGRALVAAVPIEVTEGSAERIGAPDGTFDAVVACMVLCSVADQAAALAECRRVLRPDGQLRFFEHVRARSSGMRRVQNIVDATVWPRLCGGCHTGRDTVAAVRAAGFEITELQRFTFPETRLPSPAAAHVLGTAVRAEDVHPDR